MNAPWCAPPWTQTCGPFLLPGGGTLTADLGMRPSAAGLTVNTTAGGSGVNGPATAQLGIAINHVKANWSDPRQAIVGAGEIDGLNVFCRQGGANSDCGGILVNVQNTGLSFVTSSQMVSSVVNPGTGQITKYIDLTLGALDGPSSLAYGMVFTANTGALDHGILIQDSGGGTWSNALTVMKGGAEVLVITGAGGLLLPSLVNATNDTTAAAAGVPVSGVYRNGSQLMVRVA